MSSALARSASGSPGNEPAGAESTGIAGWSGRLPRWMRTALWMQLAGGVCVLVLLPGMPRAAARALGSDRLDAAVAAVAQALQRFVLAPLPLAPESAMHVVTSVVLGLLVTFAFVVGLAQLRFRALPVLRRAVLPAVAGMMLLPLVAWGIVTVRTAWWISS